MYFGTKIRIIREFKGYSQEYMADKLGVSQSTYSTYESGKVKLTVDILLIICKELEMSVCDILNEKPLGVEFKEGPLDTDNFFIRFQGMLDGQRIFYEKIREDEIKRLEEVIERMESLFTNSTAKN